MVIMCLKVLIIPRNYGSLYFILIICNLYKFVKASFLIVFSILEKFFLNSDAIFVQFINQVLEKNLGLWKCFCCSFYCRIQSGKLVPFSYEKDKIFPHVEIWISKIPEKLWITKHKCFIKNQKLHIWSVYFGTLAVFNSICGRNSSFGTKILE